MTPVMEWVTTGKKAANIDRPSVLFAPALEEYMVYVCAMLSGRLRQHHQRSEKWQCHGSACGREPSRGNTQHTAERERDVLCKECHKDYRIGIAKDHTCERWDDPMRIGPARPTEDL